MSELSSFAKPRPVVAVCDGTILRRSNTFERHPRAYEPWTDDEDRSLANLFRSGVTVARIAGQLGRNRGAIRSRLVKMGLVESFSAKERERFDRVEGLA
jgi:hypothetical protein